MVFIGFAFVTAANWVADASMAELERLLEALEELWAELCDDELDCVEVAWLLLDDELLEVTLRVVEVVLVSSAEVEVTTATVGEVYHPISLASGVHKPLS